MFCIRTRPTNLRTEKYPSSNLLIFLYFDHAWIRQKAKKKIIYFDFCRHNTTISTNNYDKWCMFYAKIYDLIFIYNQPTAFISGCSTLLDWHYWHGHYPSTSYHYINTSIFLKKFNLYGLKCLSNEHLFSFSLHGMFFMYCLFLGTGTNLGSLVKRLMKKWV